MTLRSRSKERFGVIDSVRVPSGRPDQLPSVSTSTTNRVTAPQQ